VGAQIYIDHQPDALIIRADEESTPMDAAVSCIVSSGFYALVASRFLSWPFVAIFATLGAWSGYGLAKRQRTATLRAENLEFRTSERLWMFGPTRSVARADICYLEYRNEKHREGLAQQGLFAKVKFGNVCLLPYLDEKQTASAIQALYRRFPDMPLMRSDPSFGDHFTTLGL
jgi:hypothetical protein